MKNHGLVNKNSNTEGGRNPLMLFATERIEDYVVISMALLILIIILVFY